MLVLWRSFKLPGLKMDQQQASGAAVGGIVGFLKSLTLITMISWGAVIDTALLSGIGTIVGLMVTTAWKFLKTKFR